MWCACCCREIPATSFSKKQMRLVWGGGSARCKTCVAAAEAAKREEERRAKQRRLDAAAADVERDASPQRPRLFLADAKSPYLVEVEVPADGVPVGVPYRVAGRTLTLRRDSGPRVWGETQPPVHARDRSAVQSHVRRGVSRAGGLARRGFGPWLDLAPKRL